MTNGNDPIWSRAKAPSGIPESGIQVSGARSVPPYRVGPPPPPPKAISHGHLAWAHKYLMIAFILLGLVGGTVYVILVPPMYDAATTVELVGFNQAFMNMSQVDPQGADTNTATLENMTTQVGILKSRTLLNRAVERMNLDLAPQISAPTTVFTRIRNKIPFFRQDPLVQSRVALGDAVSTLAVKPVGLTRLISIQCSSDSPDVAANFVNALANEHIQQEQSIRSGVTQQTSQWMDSQLDEARSRLSDASEKLREFVQKSGMDFFPAQATLADTKLGELRTNVAAIQADRIAKQQKWERAQKTSLVDLPDVMDDAELKSLKTELAGLRREMAALTTKYKPEHPDVKKLQVQIDETQATLEKEEAAYLKRIQSEYEGALRQEKLLNGAYNSQTHSVTAQADKAAQYAMLQRDVDTDKQIYDSLLAHSSQASLLALEPNNSIRVVDSAIPNPAPSSPKPIVDIPVGALIGAALGYSLLLLREKSRRRKLEKLFANPGFAQTVLGVPELGVIPSRQAPQPARGLLSGVPWRRPPIPENGDEIGEPGENEHSMPGFSIIENGDRSSMLAESFRQTLVSLLRTKPRGHSPVYVITSAGPGEGKTTLSANLARAMAEIGQRVLLVDADLRRPHVHSLLGLGDHAGLSDTLASPVSLQNLVLENYIQPTKIENLSVMTHGLTKSETPLFFSSRVPELVELLQARYDCVLIDTAPALPFPDARLWGRHSDGVVLVVRAGVTTREGASAACERFLNDGIPVLGTILNDWKPEDPSSLAYFYYGYEKSRS